MTDFEQFVAFMLALGIVSGGFILVHLAQTAPVLP